MSGGEQQVGGGEPAQRRREHARSGGKWRREQARGGGKRRREQARGGGDRRLGALRIPTFDFEIENNDLPLLISILRKKE
jgi:hypothetical protein